MNAPARGRPPGSGYVGHFRFVVVYDGAAYSWCPSDGLRELFLRDVKPARHTAPRPVSDNVADPRLRFIRG